MTSEQTGIRDTKDFSEEFQQLKQVYEKYRADKKQIIRSYQRKTSLIRAAWMVAPLGIYYLVRSKVDANVYFPLSIAFSALGMLFTGNISPQDELEKLEENFFMAYICPGCSTYLGQLSWQVYHNHGKCARCGARYK